MTNPLIPITISHLSYAEVLISAICQEHPLTSLIYCLYEAAATALSAADAHLISNEVVPFLKILFGLPQTSSDSF